MFAYLFLFASCSLTLLYTNINNNNLEITTTTTTTMGTNIRKSKQFESFAVPPVALRARIDNFSTQIATFLDSVRSRIEHELVNTTRLVAADDDEPTSKTRLPDHVRGAAPLFPLIIYTIACYLIIRRRPGQSVLVTTGIWCLSIALILLNYER